MPILYTSLLLKTHSSCGSI